MAKTEEPRFTFKIEEMPIVGKFLRDAYVRDVAEVSVDYTDYDAAYLSDYDKALDDADKLVYPKEFTQKMKLVTDTIEKAMIDLRPNLDKLEGYVNRATGMVVNAKDFGISAVRKKINSGDQEGLDNALKILINNINNTTNNGALSAKGMTAAFAASFATAQTAIKTSNAAQNALLSDRNKKVADNIGVLNILWDKMSDIKKGFGAYYKSKKSVKVDDYNWSKYKKKIRSGNSGGGEAPEAKAA